MKLITFLMHLLIDFFLGTTALKYLSPTKSNKDSFFVALLLGMLIETSLCFWCLWAGRSLIEGLYLCILIILITNIKDIASISKTPSYLRRVTLDKLNIFSSFKWYEWIFVVLIIQKLSFALWQLYRIPTFFSDAVTHWSTQAHAIYGQHNWSMNPSESTFLAKNLQIVSEYPLQLPIWRAVSAVLNGEWNEFVSRSDSLLFFIIILGITGTTFYTLTHKRWIALGATFVIASLPLQVWHAASGYADIAVEAYLLASIVHFIKKEWCLMGLFAAGAIWSKNDGLAIYLPGLIAGLCCFNLFAKNMSFRTGFKNITSFGIGLTIVLPWLIFQSLYTTSIFNQILGPLHDLLSNTVVENKDFYVNLVQYNPNIFPKTSLQLLWEYLLLGSTFGPFWWVICLGLLFYSKNLLYDNMGRSLLVFFLVTCGIIYYVFTFTPAFEYLVIQTTIHRTMLQFAGTGWVLVGYVSMLKKKKK